MLGLRFFAPPSEKPRTLKGRSALPASLYTPCLSAPSAIETRMTFSYPSTSKQGLQNRADHAQGTFPMVFAYLDLDPGKRLG